MFHKTLLEYKGKFVENCYHKSVALATVLPNTIILMTLWYKISTKMSQWEFWIIELSSIVYIFYVIYKYMHTYICIFVWIFMHEMFFVWHGSVNKIRLNNKHPSNWNHAIVFCNRAKGVNVKFRLFQIMLFTINWANFMFAILQFCF